MLNEIESDNPYIAFGLCDLGHGLPELDSVELRGLASVHNRYGLGVERDLYFTPKHPMSVYANAASQ